MRTTHHSCFLLCPCWQQCRATYSYLDCLLIHSLFDPLIDQLFCVHIQKFFRSLSQGLWEPDKYYNLSRWDQQRFLKLMNRSSKAAPWHVSEVYSALLRQKGRNSRRSELFSISKSCVFDQMVVMWSVDWGGDQCHWLLWVLGLRWLRSSCLRHGVWKGRWFGRQRVCCW